MRKTLIILVALLLILAIAGSSFATPLALPTIAADSAVNNVEAYFMTFWIYDSPEDTFTNGEVTGRNEWHANIGSGSPLTGFTLTLDSILSFDHFQKENLTTTGPPTYEWSFGDVPAKTQSGAYVGFGSLDSPGVVPVTFTPGYDASRSADKTEFLQSEGTQIQTLTVTLTPRAEVDVNIGIHADENELVNSVIVSPTSGEGIQLSHNGHRLNISPTGLQLNTTWTIDVLIEVTPKAPEIEFMPYVHIGWHETLASGTVSGSSISHPVGDPVDEAGTWTWSAEGSYDWHWEDELIRQVGWCDYSRRIGEDSTPVALEEGSHVHVDFLTSYTYEVPGDVFINGEVTGRMDWHTRIVNTPDETGEVVKDLKVTLTSPDNGALIGEWSYGDVPEGPSTCWTPDAVYFGDIKHHPCTFTPGFDASISIDKTVFTAPDTQTVTITVTPRDERATDHLPLEVVVPRFESGVVDAVIISHTGEGEFELSPDGSVFAIWQENLELNIPWSVTTTLQVTPKIPEVEFRPGFSMGIGLRGETSGTTTGSSVSYTNEAGTWTVSAEGDYVWNWQAQSPNGYGVDWNGTGRPLTPSEEIWDVIILISVIAVATGLGIYFFRRRRRRVA